MKHLLRYFGLTVLEGKQWPVLKMFTPGKIMR